MIRRRRATIESEMAENLIWRLVCRYKVFFLVGIIIFGIQIFLAYKSLNLTNAIANDEAGNYMAHSSVSGVNRRSVAGADSTNGDDEDSPLADKRQQPSSSSSSSNNADIHGDTPASSTLISPQQLGFIPACDIISKDAISALQRAKTKDCRQHIAGIACAIQSAEFYPAKLPSYCPSNHTAAKPLGCYRDEKKFRLLSGYFINFKTSNTPEKCVQLCLQSGFPYAGVQYGSECFCGTDVPPDSAKLSDSTCNMKCSGSVQEVCGGYFAMNIYETGIESK